MEELQKQILSALFPDGKFSAEAAQQLAEFTKGEGKQADQSIVQPRLSNDQRIALEDKKLGMLSPHKKEAMQRIMDATKFGSDLANDRFAQQMGTFTGSVNQTLGLGYDAQDKLSKRRDDTHRYMIDDQSGHRDKDRELIRKQQNIDMISRLGAGGLLLLDVLRN